MAQNSSPGRNGGQQPPFEIVLDEGCSIVCDEVPVNCTIRMLPVDGRSPPRMSPASQWAEDYSSGDSSSGGGQGWGSQQRDRYGNVVGSPIASPPSPLRSRRSIVESVRRNNQENTGATRNAVGIHKGFEESEHEVFAFRKPSPTPSFSSASSYATSSSRQPSPPAAESTDSLLNSNRLQKEFKRANIYVEGTDLREMHTNLGPWTKTTDERPQLANASFSPPSPSKGGRCCGMAEYSSADYRSKTPESDQSKTLTTESGGAVFASTSSTAGGKCSYHGILPCPTRAHCRCRENRPGRGSGSAPSSPGFPGGRSCSYHNTLPCPAMAGVPCRGEIQKSGVSTPSPSRTPSPGQRPPRYPGAPSLPESSPNSPRDMRSQTVPELNSRPASPGGSPGVAYPPRTISPPPKSPRSRTPSRRPPQKYKGDCL